MAQAAYSLINSQYGPAIRCSTCGHVSHNYNDIMNLFCGNCKIWFVEDASLENSYIRKDTYKDRPPMYTLCVLRHVRGKKKQIDQYPILEEHAANYTLKHGLETHTFNEDDRKQGL